jgi:hypothetical protein
MRKLPQDVFAVQQEMWGCLLRRTKIVAMQQKLY